MERLKVRYGFKGQSESFRLQLRARRQQQGETLSSLEQDIRKLIALAYPGEASDIIESIARDAFIGALCDRDLALQVLAKEPETLERAYQVASKLKSYSDLIHAEEQHMSSTSKMCGLQREEETDSELRQIKEEMREMVQAIQGISKQVTRISEDVEKMKCPSDGRNREIGISKNGDFQTDKFRTYTNSIVCFQCNQRGHKRFECPVGNSDHTFETRKRRESRSFRRSGRTRTVKIPPRSEVGAALEEFLDDFEEQFGEEARGGQEAEETPGKATAYLMSEPSVPGSSQNEIRLEGECGVPSDLAVGNPQDPDTVSSYSYERKAYKTNSSDNRSSIARPRGAQWRIWEVHLKGGANLIFDVGE